MIKLIERLITIVKSRGADDSLPGPYVPDFVRPPIFMRIDSINATQESSAQFMGYGWCQGIHTSLTDLVFKLVDTLDRDLVGAEWTASTVRIPLGKELLIRADGITRHESLSVLVDTETMMFLFLPFPRWTSDKPYADLIFGGPTPETLALLREIALKLQCRIDSIESSPNGDMLVVFRPRSSFEGLTDITLKTKMVLEELLEEEKGNTQWKRK